jgi:hypothetical protein
MPFSNNTHIHQQEVRMNTNIQDDYLKSTHVATMVTQRLMVDKKYGDKKEHDKTIRFDNAFKKVYLSPDNLETNVKTLLSNCHQLTTPMNKQNDYGYFQYNDSDGETKKDLNNRIED